MGFYDAKGYWRNDGDGFYDSKGYFRSPGDGFYDGKGYFRSCGEGFYDFQGNWVNPGGAFYDSKGYLRSQTTSVASTTNSGENVVGTIGIVLLLPFVLFGFILVSLIEWISSHFYMVLIGYCTFATLTCFILVKIRKYHGKACVMSFLGNYLCILSYLYITLLYTVPNVMINGVNFDTVFEFVLVSVFGMGGIAIVQFFNYYHEKAVLEFLCGTIYFVVVTYILKNGLNTINSTTTLADIYNIENSEILKFLFGFVI